MAGGSGASCCVMRRAPGVLWVPPVPVRRRLWGGEGVCVCGVGLWVMSHRRMPSRCVSWRVSRRCLRTCGWSWGARRLRGWTPRCGAHRPAWLPMRPVASTPPTAGGGGSPPTIAGPVDQALEGGLCPGPLSQLQDVRVGPAPPPLSLGGAVALGGGVGVGGCDGGGGDWWRWRAWGIPRSPVPWGCAGSGGAGGCGLAGMRVRSPPRGWVGTCVGGGSGAFAVCGLTSRVGRGAATRLVDRGAVLVQAGVVCGPRVRALRGGGTKCVALRSRRAAP